MREGGADRPASGPPLAGGAAPCPTLEALRSVILGAFPELAFSSFALLTEGWDCVAVDVDDRLIFRFPRHQAAERRLAKEAGLLAAIRPAVTMRVPEPILHPGPPLFARHAKIAGEHLLGAQYQALPAASRQRLAADMALFFAELHALDARVMERAGAGPVTPWLPPEAILRRVWPVLPPRLRSYAERTITAWQDLPPDPHGTTYGFFDGHGWNMAFDHTAGRLNGLYDFGGSGFGPLHREFVYPNWIARDLTARIVAEYEALTGRALDGARIALLSGVLRLSELADHAGDAARAPAMLRIVADWAGGRPP
ncbi:phosphotransferase family protein [Crenalkalicoccus roseus]|uniref:phosphotransferase family protein n=1 Tax=Crenalkalicoccus roseus TaxID=1485588 RepID=UPI001080EE73|nr:aminoglycoside phosphotransferase family protein [Crenalkalicoccus roseus]